MLFSSSGLKPLNLCVLIHNILSRKLTVREEGEDCSLRWAINSLTTIFDPADGSTIYFRKLRNTAHIKML
jgi:hypothetical protein